MPEVTVTPAEFADFRASVGRVLFARRRDSRMRLRDVAAAAGLTTGYVSQLELGHSAPSLEALYRLSLAFGCTVVELLSGSGE